MADLLLRNMTGIYLSYGEKMLLLYREGGRVVNHVWVASAGGHFEKDELNDPEKCVLRELKEELNLTGDALNRLKLRYIGLRLIHGEVRQNYYFFADLKPEYFEEFTSEEGKCKWVDFKDVLKYEMPLTAKFVVEHYMTTGRFTNALYCAVSEGKDFQFVEMKEG